MKYARLALLALLAACSGTVDLGGAPSGATGAPGSDPFANEVDPELVPASKVDLLFVVDNSPSMAEKQEILAGSVGRLVRRIVQPNCVGPENNAVLERSSNGACSVGVLEHAPIADVHVGVISTSLGTGGGDVCSSGDLPRMNDRAHLQRRGKGGVSLPNAAQGFLAYAPTGGASSIADAATLERDTAALILGVEQTGCGLEAQLESMYRFLVQPDPPAVVRLNHLNQAEYDGVDAELLTERAAFLRPDSAVVIVMLTDEDDSMVDPLSVAGQGWTFATKDFPGSSVFRDGANTSLGTTAPRATTACATDPASPSCTSCAFKWFCESKPICEVLRQDPNCAATGIPGRTGAGYSGYYGPTDDALNVRFHRLKERFGVDPQFPIERYVRALTNRKVPDRASEHPSGQKPAYDPAYVAYVHAPKCTNPLFAASLPSKPGDEVCDLPEGIRSRRLVHFGLIAGVPRELADGRPLGAAEWTKIVGANPEAYDESGIDPHMIQSTVPRLGLPPPATTRGDNGPDPIHGREWDTRREDLQYACTFALPSPKRCEADDRTCDCRENGVNPPLCGSTSGEQVRGKAYPSIRPLRVAKRLGERATVASICAADATVGYAAALDALADRVSTTLVK